MPVLAPLLARVRRLFDLDANPQVVEEHLARDARLKRIVRRQSGLRVPGAFDGFELALRAILGQQVSVKGASTLFGRCAAIFGEPAALVHEPLKYFAPTAERIATAELHELISLGLPKKRAETILALARTVVRGEIKLEPGVDVEQTIQNLQALPGIGAWTAHYIAMRALGYPDAFPHADLGLMKALGLRRPGDILAAADPWRPWRAYATQHLWAAMNTMILYSTLESPIGELLLRSDGTSLTGLYMQDHKYGAERNEDWKRDDAALGKPRAQLQGYFAGELREFELLLAAGGTPFQQRVWRALSAIPYGQTISYAELARRIGQPAASRAVGLANGKNPISLVVPCHRVIGANGSLTGYGGGLERKRWLLAHENPLSR